MCINMDVNGTKLCHKWNLFAKKYQLLYFQSSLWWLFMLWLVILILICNKIALVCSWQKIEHNIVIISVSFDGNDFSSNTEQKRKFSVSTVNVKQTEAILNGKASFFEQSNKIVSFKRDNFNYSNI